MKCIYCEVEIEKDDNFCHNCGHWTPRGYSYLKKDGNINKIISGDAIKTNDKLTLTLWLLAIAFTSFTIMIVIRGDNLFKPFLYLKKQAVNYIYGYKTSTLKTDNKYQKISINTYEESIDFIKRDIDNQTWLCNNDIEMSRIEKQLEDSYNIPIVSLCDMNISQANKLKIVIDNIYQLFPNIKGKLTNIIITNASSNSEYIARFQPMYQFVNISEDINNYNKVNKTQILLNSYYFLNEDVINNSLNNIIDSNYYVKDATWESTLAHEMGHYISFVLLLKENNIDNIVFVNKNNYQQIDRIIEIFNDGSFSTEIVSQAKENYNKKYQTSLDNDAFARNISPYAAVLDKEGNLMADETIAEAVHDYYLHGDNMNKSSKEIIDVIKYRLG